MKIIWTRPGQSEYNEKKYFTGWHNPSLTERGRKEAKNVAKILRQYRYLPLSGIYCSTLSRAKETMRIMKNENFQYGLWKEVVPIIDSRLIERNCGSWAGKTKEEIINLIGEDEFSSIVNSWDVKYSSGESIEDVYHRVDDFLKFLKKEHPKKNDIVLIVCHAITIKAAMVILGYETKDTFNRFRIPNCSIIETILE